MTASLRDKLKAKKRVSTTYPLATVDTAEAEAAVRSTARQYQQALLGEDGEEAVAEAKKKLEEAQQIEADCYEDVTVTALPAPDFEALVDEHPRENGDEGNAPWHVKTFRPALLAACVDSDMTADDWVAYFKESGNNGEQAGLFTACLAINNRSPEPSLGKGSTPTIS